MASRTQYIVQPYVISFVWHATDQWFFPDIQVKLAATTVYDEKVALHEGWFL